MGNALAADNRPAALDALNTPIFTAGPQQTLATLSNLPYLRMANVGTQNLSNELFRDDQDLNH